MILHSVLPSCKVKHLLLQFLLLFPVLAEAMKNRINYLIVVSLPQKLKS